jgi:hypothetical protein
LELKVARPLLWLKAKLPGEGTPMTFRYDFDTTPYFATVAATLIRRHGDDALLLANHAIQRMKMSGDAEGIFLWEGVRSAMFDTLVDAMSGPDTAATHAPGASAPLCH